MVLDVSSSSDRKPSKKTNPTDMISSQITHYLAKQQVTTTCIVNVENYSSGILYFQM